MKRTPIVPARGFFRSVLLASCCAAMLASGSAIAQTGGGGMKAMLQQKVAAIKASSTENQQKLHQYTWTETSNITANGRQIPPKVSNCFYGPDGKVHKTPVGDTQEASADNNRRGGRLMQRIKEKKTAEMKDYMQQVAGVIKLYVPPSPEMMQKAFEAHKVSFDKTGGRVDLVFKDYALSGDSMTVDFDTASKKIRSLSVKSYLDTPQNPVTLEVDFATLPDGTNHPSRTTLEARGQDIIEVTSVNSNYRKGS